MTPPNLTPDQLALLRRIDELEEAGSPLVAEGKSMADDEHLALCHLIEHGLTRHPPTYIVTPAGRRALGEAEEEGDADL